MEKLDIRTAYERKQQERDARLCAMYGELRKQFPGSSNARIFRIMAEKASMTPNGVRCALIRNNVIPKRQDGDYLRRQRVPIARP